MTLKDLVEEWTYWWLNEDAQHLRFGQYIINNYYKGELWAELFYEIDDDKAFAMLAERIENESND